MDFYEPIYAWEHRRLQERPEENPYRSFDSFQHNAFTLLQRKVQQGYPLYPEVDERFMIDRRNLLQHNSDCIVGNFNPPKARRHIVRPVIPRHAMTVERLQHMARLTHIFLHVTQQPRWLADYS